MVVLTNLNRKETMVKIDLEHGDCLELMTKIPDESVDMILCDLPYGTTASNWDKIINFVELWKQYNRIIKEHGCIALFGREPFSSELRLSNKKLYRYDWIWKKTLPGRYVQSHKMPLRSHEIISIFYKRLPLYNPQFTEGKPYKFKRGNIGSNYKSSKPNITISNGKRYPRDVLKIKWVTSNSHPTEKPVSLLEYLIKTYTNENMTVLDNCMGSGSTGVACVNTNRNFIGMELDDKYFEIAQERLRLAKEVKSE